MVRKTTRNSSITRKGFIGASLLALAGLAGCAKEPIPTVEWEESIDVGYFDPITDEQPEGSYADYDEGSYYYGGDNFRYIAVHTIINSRIETQNGMASYRATINYECFDLFWDVDRDEPDSLYFRSGGTLGDGIGVESGTLYEVDLSLCNLSTGDDVIEIQIPKSAMENMRAGLSSDGYHPSDGAVIRFPAAAISGDTEVIDTYVGDWFISSDIGSGEREQTMSVNSDFTGTYRHKLISDSQGTIFNETFSAEQFTPDGTWQTGYDEEDQQSPIIAGYVLEGEPSLLYLTKMNKAEWIAFSIAVTDTTRTLRPW